MIIQETCKKILQLKHFGAAHSIKIRTVQIIAFATLCFSLLSFASLIEIQKIFTGAAHQLQIQTAAEATEELLLLEHADVASALNDWGVWDEPYAYLTRGNTTFEEDNLLPEDLRRLHIDGYILSSSNRRVALTTSKRNAALPKHITSGWFEKSSEKLHHMPKDFVDHLLKKGDHFLKASRSNIKKTAITWAEEYQGRFFIAGAIQVLRSDYNGPPAGLFLFLRTLDSEFTAKLALITRKETYFIDPRRSVLFNQEMKQAEKISTRFGQRLLLIRPEDKGVAHVYLPLSDSEGNARLYLSVAVPNSLQSAATQNLLFSLISSLCSGLLLGVVVFYLLDKTVVSRLSQLSSAALKISRAKDFNKRFETGGSDEIARLAGSMNRMMITLEDLNNKITLSRQKSENVLLQLMPEHVAHQLKEGNRNIAEFNPSVTVIFADIVNFTPLAERLTPQELVALLNEIVSAFDTLCTECGLEKIKTIGDAYMAVGGLEQISTQEKVISDPTSPAATLNHAASAMLFARRLLAKTEQIGAMKQLDLRLRIGINTGPAVSGVIGK